MILPKTLACINLNTNNKIGNQKIPPILRGDIIHYELVSPFLLLYNCPMNLMVEII